jgi:molecular chaperone GrpE
MSSKKQKDQEQQEKKKKKDAAAEQEAAETGTQAVSESESSGDAAGLGVAEGGEQSQKAAETGGGEQTEELRRRVEELEQENSELKAQYLRKQADFENFRKRMQREKQEAIKYANTNLLQDIVAIIDDFERAIKSSEESKDFDSFHSGIQLIERQLVNMLENKYGLKRMESEGEEFDPQKHEAIAMVESPEHDTQTVVEDYQKGYMINDRVLRHAKVRVAIPAQNADGVAHTGDQGSDSGEQGGGNGENGS